MNKSTSCGVVIEGEANRRWKDQSVEVPLGVPRGSRLLSFRIQRIPANAIRCGSTKLTTQGGRLSLRRVSFLRMCGAFTLRSAEANEIIYKVRRAVAEAGSGLGTKVRTKKPPQPGGQQQKESFDEEHPLALCHRCVGNRRLFCRTAGKLGPRSRRRDSSSIRRRTSFPRPSTRPSGRHTARRWRNGARRRR